MKYARIDGVVRWTGGVTVLNKGVTTADADHPLVLERPDLFTDDVPVPHLRGPAAAAEATGRVENATARPGTKRGSRA